MAGRLLEAPGGIALSKAGMDREIARELLARLNHDAERGNLPAGTRGPARLRSARVRAGTDAAYVVLREKLRDRGGA